MDANKLLINKLLLAGAALLLAGCGAGDFNYGKVGNIIQAAPMRLDAEYVMLTPQQVQCGVQEDLWDPPTDVGGRRYAHLTDKGRDLKFADDVSIGDMNRPYVQVRGDFSLAVNEITSDRDGPEQGTKLVQTKISIPIQHSCFPDPLPLMGIRKGNFSQDASPMLLFRYDNGWKLERFVH